MTAQVSNTVDSSDEAFDFVKMLAADVSTEKVELPAFPDIVRPGSKASGNHTTVALRDRSRHYRKLGLFRGYGDRY